MLEEPLRVVIVDDHDIYRRGLRAQFELDENGSIEIVGEFSTAQEAVLAVPELRPSVTLMDLHMPRSDGEKATDCGIDAIKEILKAWPEAAIVVLTVYEDVAHAREVVEAGARGCLVKSNKNTDYAAIMRRIASGEYVFAGRIGDFLRHIVPGTVNGRHPFPQLTRREQEIVDLAAEGLNNNEIARKLVLEKKTVDNHLLAIRGKLGVANRQEAVEKARAAGLGHAVEEN